MPGVMSVMPGSLAADTASISACTRIRSARSSCMGPNSTSRLSSPLRRYVTSASRASTPPSAISARSATGEAAGVRRSRAASGTVTGTKRTVSPGRSCPSFQRCPFAMVAGQTNPPSEGPSGPSSTGMSPV